MTRLLRYRDLRARGIVDNRPQLGRLKEKHGFPPGRMLSPNTRVWTEAEVDDWIASLPVATGPALRGAAKALQARKRAAQTEGSTPAPERGGPENAVTAQP